MGNLSDMNAPFIKQLQLGPMANFVYLIGDKEAGPFLSGKRGILTKTMLLF